MVKPPTPLPTDIVMTIRSDSVFLKAPDHDENTAVPDDFLVALGVSRAFHDPIFRRTMLVLAQTVIERGDVDGITVHGGTMQ